MHNSQNIVIFYSFGMCLEKGRKRVKWQLFGKLKKLVHHPMTKNNCYKQMEVEIRVSTS